MTIDLREKLQKREPSQLILSDEVTVTVKNDAMGMLECMSLLSDSKKLTSANMMPIINLLFSNEDVEKIKGLGLELSPFQELITQAIQTITGKGETAKKKLTAATK